MAAITIRNLSEATRRALKTRAASHNLSMEAEARAILDAAVSEESDFITEWLRATEHLRGDDIETPQRSPARVIDLA